MKNKITFFILWLEAPCKTVWALRRRKEIFTKDQFIIYLINAMAFLKQSMALPGSANNFINISCLHIVILPKKGIWQTNYCLCEHCTSLTQYTEWASVWMGFLKFPHFISVCTELIESSVLKGEGLHKCKSVILQCISEK